MLKIVNLNTCIILTNRANTGTVCTLFVSLSTSSGEFHRLCALATKCTSPRRNVPATKRQATKCPHDEAAGNEVYLRRNGWRRSVPATKWLATKCNHDETAATKLPAPTREPVQTDELQFTEKNVENDVEEMIEKGLEYVKDKETDEINEKSHGRRPLLMRRRHDVVRRKWS